LHEVQEILNIVGIEFTQPIGVCEAASDKRIVVTA